MNVTVVREQRILRAVATAALATAVCASACGARTPLQEAAGAGSGGAMTTGGSGGTSIGPVMTCGAVAQATPVLTVDAAHGNAVQPSLVVLESASPKAAVVYAWQGSSPGAGVAARVASFDGWGTWPPAPVIAHVQHTETGEPLSSVSLVAQSNPPIGPTSFDLLFSPKAIQTPDFNNLPEIVYSAGTDGATPLVQGTIAGTAQFIAGGGTASSLAWPLNVNLLSGVSQQLPGSTPKFVLVAEPGPNNGGNYHWLGCSTTPLAADAVTAEAGWLVAAGLGSPITWVGELDPGQGQGKSCALDPSVPVGPGTALTLAIIGGSPIDDHWLQQTQVLEMSSPVTRVRLANRAAGGTWAVLSLDGAPALSVGIVSGSLTLDTTFAIPAAQGTLVPTSFAIDAFGSTLVVAVVEQMAGDHDQVQVTAMDESGGTVWSATVPTDGAVEGAVSLRAAPDGSSLLLAWSELPPGATAHRLRVARLDCTTCAAVGAACTTGSDCCGGICKHGSCASAATGAAPSCTSDADCSNGAACDPKLGICIASAVCTSDADCQDGDVCNTALSMCISVSIDCKSNADCPAGEPCDKHTGTCLPGTCVSTDGACKSNHDCCSEACHKSTGRCD